MPEGLQSPSGGQVPQMPRSGPQGITKPPFVRQTSQGDPYAKMPPTPVAPSSQQDDPTGLLSVPFQVQETEV
jgi:hypothetical protein